MQVNGMVMHCAQAKPSRLALALVLSLMATLLSASAAQAAYALEVTTVANPAEGGVVVSYDYNYDSEATVFGSGDSVALKATPNSGYALDSIVVTDADGNEVATHEDNYGSYDAVFSMPSSNVTATANFKESAEPPAPSDYAIDVAAGIAGGSVKVTTYADQNTPITRSAKGEYVYLTAIPDEGFDFESISVTDAAGNELSGSNAVQRDTWNKEVIG
jgi:hypothetical protein